MNQVLPAETRDRLRRLIREIEERPPAPRSLLRVAPRAAAPLDGAVRRETAAGACTYLEQRFPLDGFLVGRQPLDALRHAVGNALPLLTADAGASEAALEDLLFLDIETTGLGGAGAMVFLVATARVEGDVLRMRQYLAESPAEEGALLDALLTDARLATDDPVLVTYNGRSFDAPMLDARATMHRRRAGFEALRHIDALQPSRALYRGWLPSCRLLDVESHILGVTRPSADVDGAEVPAWYFRFLRTGDMRFVAPIASHNRLDVLSLAALTGRLAALATGAAPARGSEALGLARLLARTSPHAAATHLEVALADLARGQARREALWRLAQLRKRQDDAPGAIALWHELASTPGAWSLLAFEELAKFYEHRERDLPRAAEVVEQALRLVHETHLAHAPVQAERWQSTFRYRLARLTSRIGRAR